MNPSQILATIVALIAEHPQAVTAVLAYVTLGLLNGLLKVKVDGPAVTRVISALVDRVAPTTRRDALGTFKWPLFTASVLRGVADVFDPKDPPSGGASSGPSRETLPPPPASDVPVPPASSRRFGLFVPAFASLALVLSLAHCQPTPRPGGRYQPSGAIAAIDNVASILSILAPVLKPLVLSQIPASDIDARRAADISLTSFEGVANAWTAGRSTWDLRANNGFCDAYAATGAVTSSLRNVIVTLGRVGVGLGPDLTQLVDASGLLADRVAYCDPVFDASVPADADHDARALLRSGSVGVELRELAARVASEAQAQGRTLRPLPAIERR
jgi:hypothetical protein